MIGKIRSTLRSREEIMITEWLQKRTSVQEAEKAHMIEDERLGPTPVPFGIQNDRWLHLKNQIQSDDELWEFSSPPESWQHLAGRAGLCIVRKGVIVDSIVTVLN